MLPFDLKICGLRELPDALTGSVSHVISILDPHDPVPAALSMRETVTRHDLRFHDDIDARPERQPPVDGDVGKLIDIGASLREQEVSGLLVHCWAGVSRSTASAMTLMAQAAPGREAEIPDALLAVRSPVWPNSRIIRMADIALGSEGRLIAAMEEVFRRVVEAHPQMVETMRGYNRGHEIPEV